MGNKNNDGQENFADSSKEQELAIKMSNVIIDSVKGAALSINGIYKQQMDVGVLVENLQKQVDEVLAGDLSRVEGMLIMQAQTLNVLFNRMTSKMMDSEFHSSVEMYSNVALRAQNQCRQTLAVLSDLKRPQQTTVVQQQNLAINQQVNNPALPQGSKEKTKSANELLEVAHGSVDGGTAITPIKADFQLEAVGKVYGGEIE